MTHGETHLNKYFQCNECTGTFFHTDSLKATHDDASWGKKLFIYNKCNICDVTTVEQIEQI
jgi:hypothetical protein